MYMGVSVVKKLSVPIASMRGYLVPHAIKACKQVVAGGKKEHRLDQRGAELGQGHAEGAHSNRNAKEGKAMLMEGITVKLEAEGVLGKQKRHERSKEYAHPRVARRRLEEKDNARKDGGEERERLVRGEDDPNVEVTHRA